jgi:serine/threonine-protein kinase HipA
MMTSEPKSLFVWIWLPGQNVPVVAGQVVRNEDTAVIHFGYARSYRKNPNAIPIFTPD